MTLSEDGQWMWDGNQWVPAQNAPPAAPPAAGGNLGFTDPNSQSWDAPQPFGGQPMADPNPGGWAPDSSSPSAKKSLPVAAIVAVVILIVAGATGGILWATGVFGSSADDLVGVWYGGDDRDGAQFKEDGSFIIIEDGNPADGYDTFDSLTWSVSGDRMILTFTMIMLTDDFECDTGNQSVSRYYVNDGDNDCGDNSDEGVNIRNYPHETNSFSSESKFEIKGDVLFVGMLKQTQTEGGTVETEEILESQVCTSGQSECEALVRASAMGGGLNHSMIVSGATAPDWWADTSENYDEDDY